MVAKTKRDCSLFFGMTGLGRKLLSFEFFFPPKWWLLCFFLPKIDQVVLRCWINLRLSQEKWQFLWINKAWKIILTVVVPDVHITIKFFILDSLIFYAWMSVICGPWDESVWNFLRRHFAGKLVMVIFLGWLLCWLFYNGYSSTLSLP